MSEKTYYPPDDTYVCPQCGSKDVEVSVFVHINNWKPVDHSDWYNSDTWCPTCEDHGIGVITLKEYNDAKTI